MHTVKKGFIGIVGLLAAGGVAWATAVPNPTTSDVDHNTAGGSGTLGSINTDTHVSYDNTAFGFGSGGGLNGGGQNTLFGSNAMPQAASATANNNTAIGYDTLYYNTGDANTAVGSQVMTENTSGSNNTGLGFSALLTNSTGANNVALGNNTLLSNTTGAANMASGYRALEANLDGSYNTAAGGFTLFMNQSGAFNTAVGYAALQDNTASNNNAVGAYALNENTSGANNNAQGINAMQHNTSGSNNAAFGSGALKNNLTSNSNTAIGSQALLKSTGAGNVAIGSGAGLNLLTGSNNLYIANQGLASETGVIRIGSGVHTKTVIAGIADGAVSNAASVQINTATGELGIAVSSARFKSDIAEIGDADLKLAQLTPVHFTYKADATHAKRYGLIAEDVAKVYPELVTHNANGEVQTVEYQALIPLLLKQVQMQQADNQRQQAEIAELRAQLQKLAVAAEASAVH